MIRKHHCPLNGKYIRKHQCCLNEKCLTDNVLYKACIIPNEENSKAKIYNGVSETVFKLRYEKQKKIIQQHQIPN